MKELSIEEKAKRYDNALERTKEIVNDQNASSVWKGWLCNCFPELKESEDDIREDCIAYIDGMLEAAIEKNDKEEIVELRKILAWLEKQGEQKPADKVEPKFNIGDTIYNKVTKERCTITNRSLALQYYHDEDHLHEIRFSEQDDWEIIKPKFHEGEWITNGDYTWKIVEVKSLDYILQSQNGNIVDDTISHIDKQFHSFTIEDAKDGDVLIYNHQPFKWIFIFKRLYSPIIVSYYVMFTEKNKIYIDDSISTNFLSKITPATKEQCDLLFKKMKDAGYEWDAEKKELKKIEQSIEIPFGAKDSELQEASYHIPEGFHAEIEGNRVVIKRGEQKPQRIISAEVKETMYDKPAWSEKDEEILNVVIKSCEQCGNEYAYYWLKSLKERIGG